MKRIFLALGLLLILASCKKEELGLMEGDYFVFGETYGFCHGNCAHLYLIKDGKIYRDNVDQFWSGDLSFQEDPLAAEKFDRASTLAADFPQFLKENPDKTFGCPDCADQGRIYIELKQGDKVMSWAIDPTADSQPDEIRDYIAAMQEVLNQLRQP